MRERKRGIERDYGLCKSSLPNESITPKSMTAYLKNSYNPYVNVLQICGNVYHCLFVFI